jgi:hypothetical protein
MKQQNDELEQQKIDSQACTMLGSARGDMAKHRMKVTLEYDDNNQITFPPFESKLRVKLQTDRHAIRNK